MLRRIAVHVALWWTFSSACLACGCAEPERPCENLQADVVFVGRVIEQLPDLPVLVEQRAFWMGSATRFTVEEVIRGRVGTEEIVFGGLGWNLPAGDRFLIFGRYADDGRIVAGVCSGTGRLDGTNDEELIAPYRRMAKSRVAGPIFGTATWSTGAEPRYALHPISNLRVRAISADGTFVTTTAKDGTFEFVGLPEGTYTVVPDPIAGWDYYKYADMERAELKDGSCRNVTFRFRPATRIRGRLAWLGGVEPRSIRVTATPVECSNASCQTWALADHTGEFDFWPLPAGDYHLSVNVDTSPHRDSPFLPTYFPGVKAAEAAAIIRIAEGETKEVQFFLPESASERPIDVRVVDREGRPVAGAEIELEDVEYPGMAVGSDNLFADSEGNAEITAYAGYSYHVHASKSLEPGRMLCSRPVLVQAGAEPLRARIILDVEAEYCSMEEMDGR